MADQGTAPHEGGYRGQPAIPQTPGLITVELTSAHCIDDFRCERNPEAVAYLQKDVWPQLRAHCGAVYVRVAGDDPTRIEAYYHLSGSSLRKGEAQNRDQQDWPSSDPVPVYVIAYVARDDRAAKGLGAAMVVDAARRGMSLFPTWGLVLFARNAQLLGFYRDLGFKVIRSVKQQMDSDSGLTSDGPFMMYAKYDWLIVDEGDCS